MNTPLTFAHLMLLTLLALLGSGCTRGLNESPIQFEEKSTRHTENMTPAEWESFKNKAIESIIRRYSGQSMTTSGQVQVVDLTQPSSVSASISPSVTEDPTVIEPKYKEERLPNKLYVPETLAPSNLPAFKSPPVKSKDNSFAKVDRYSQLKIKPEETKGKQYKVPPNALTQSPTDQTTATPYVWPVQGTISKEYGKSATGTNNGINITAAAGSPIVAIERGKVIFVGSIKSMGKVILIEHPNQMIAAYAQVGGITVRANDIVKKGQKIADILSTEGSDGELHFELRKGTQSLNPTEYLRKQ